MSYYGNFTIQKAQKRQETYEKKKAQMRKGCWAAPATNFKILADENIAVKNYRDTAVDMLLLAFPDLTKTEIQYSVDRCISEKIKFYDATVDNSYKKTKVEITLPELAHYILSREPIMTTYGVLFSKHSDVPSPLYKMVDSFINTRDQVKKKMFSYPKGSFEFEKYSLLQLLYKLDANAFYGVILAHLIW